MNRSFPTTCLLVALLLSIQLISCTKPPVNFDPRDGNNTYSGCRINQITGAGVTRQVIYNNSNDPISVEASFAGTGSPNLSFKYNKKGLLVEYAGLYSNSSFEFLHRYGYTNGRATTDTIYTLGPYSNPANSFSKRISYLQYDGLNRVVQDSEINIFPLTITNIIHYRYDINGNLLSGATAPYDNKMNPHRTNKIWMFTDRNYSVNNPAAAESYNMAGLPLVFHASGKFSLTMVLAYFYYYGDMQIRYECR